MKVIRLATVAIVGASLAFAQTSPSDIKKPDSDLEQIGTLNGQPVFGLKDVAAIDFTTGTTASHPLEINKRSPLLLSKMYARKWATSSCESSRSS